MGDILQILIIIGIIIFAVVKQIAGSSEEGKKQQRRPVVLPDEDDDEDWKEMEIAKERHKPFLSYDFDHYNPLDDTKQEISPPPPIQEEPGEEESEFDIHSTEEVRRAIIWSEILNRKY